MPFHPSMVWGKSALSLQHWWTLDLGSVTLSSSEAATPLAGQEAHRSGLASLLCAAGDLGTSVGCKSVLCCLNFPDLQLRPDLPLLCDESTLLIGNPILEGCQPNAEPALLGSAGRI